VEGDNNAAPAGVIGSQVPGTLLDRAVARGAIQSLGVQPRGNVTNLAEPFSSRSFK
jgi:hypothetical protein